MTPATRRRLRAAVLALPVRQRDQHLGALADLLHLLEHCAQRCKPRGFVAEHQAYWLPALPWVAELLEQAWIKCTATNCPRPCHVALLNEPVTGGGRR